jgi:hypothetical protein
LRRKRRGARFFAKESWSGSVRQKCRLSRTSFFHHLPLFEYSLSGHFLVWSLGLSIDDRDPLHLKLSEDASMKWPPRQLVLDHAVKEGFSSNLSEANSRSVCPQYRYARSFLIKAPTILINPVPPPMKSVKSNASPRAWA